MKAQPGISILSGPSRVVSHGPVSGGLQRGHPHPTLPSPTHCLTRFPINAVVTRARDSGCMPRTRHPGPGPGRDDTPLFGQATRCRCANLGKNKTQPTTNAPWFNQKFAPANHPPHRPGPVHSTEQLRDVYPQIDASTRQRARQYPTPLDHGAAKRSRTQHLSAPWPNDFEGSTSRKSAPPIEPRISNALIEGIKPPKNPTP